MYFLTLIALSLLPISVAQTEPVGSECNGGTCPLPTMMSTGGAPSPNDAGVASNNGGNRKNEESEVGCGLWMGPSPIKQAENHGFGLGIFTGKAIPAGTPIESIYGHGELLLPIYGSESIYEAHPPLREYIWDEDNLPETAVEYPFELTALFVPGLAAIAPCTSENYNLKLGDERGWSASSDDGGVHRSTHPHAGAFSYRHNVTYVSVRDIAAGEELTVNCDDDSFDGGAYYLTMYESSKNDDRVTCLDQNLRVDRSTQLATSPSVDNNNNSYNNKDDPMGMGLFAKRVLAKGESIISSPLTPIHREVLEIDNDVDVNDKQLMLNYVFGHPESDLLLLPIGPMVNFINHRRKSDGGANAEIRWHHLNDRGEPKLKNMDDLKGYHDASLLDLPGDVVATLHGKGLVMDIVALRDISEGEEVYLDYGDEWQASWDKHAASFQRLQKSQQDREYRSAENENKLIQKTFEQTLDMMKLKTDAPLSYTYRTESEEDLDPYPENVEFFCFYHLSHHEDDEDNESNASSLRKTNDDEFKQFSWQDHSSHDCFRPCQLIERYPYEFGGFSEENFDTNQPFYTVEMLSEDNDRVQGHCGISTDYVLQDVPQAEIRLLDSPFTTDVLRPSAFRHEIGVPEGFYPENWMAERKRLRRSRGSNTEDASNNYKKTKQSSNKVTYS